MRYFIFVLMFMFSMNVFAQDAEDTSDDEAPVVAVEDVEPFMDNLGNRFIYAFFGRKALIFMLNDDDHKRIATDVDVNVLDVAAAPFNMKLAGFYTASLFKLLSFYYIAYFFLRATHKAFEMAWMGQKLGSLPMRPGEFRQFALRIILVAGLVFIPFGMMNVFQVGVLKLYYETSTLTDKAATNLIENRTEIIPTVSMPSADSKQEDMLAVLSYTSCVAMAGGDASVNNLKFYKDDVVGGLYASLSNGDCHLSINLALNTKMDTQIKRLYERQGIDLPTDIYLDAQKQVYRELFTDIFAQANRYSKYLTNDGDDRLYVDRHAEDMSAWGNYRYGNNSESWESSCDEFIVTDFGDDEVTQFDRQAHAYHASRCLSYVVNEHLLYPTYHDDVEGFLDTGVLDYRQLMLCEEDLATLDPNGSILTPIAPNPFATDAERTQINVESCALRACSQNALVNGSLYMCANAVALVQKRERDERIAAQGNMIMGAYIYELFTAPLEFKSGRDLFNGLKVRFSEYAITTPSSVDLTDSLFNINVEPITDKSTENSDVHLEAIETSLIFKDVTSFMRGEPKSLNVFMASISPFKRLATCVQAPLSVSNGYLCGSVPQEMNKMGVDAINFAIDLKVIMTTAQLLNDMRKRIALNKKKEDGTVVSKNSKELMMRAAGFFGVGSNVIQDMLDVTTSPLNDPFDTRLRANETSDAFLSDKIGLIVIGALSTNSFVGTLIDSAIVMLLLGGLFLGIILPMMPMLLFIIALSMAFFLLFKVIIIGPIQLIDIAFEEDSNMLTQKAERLIGDIVAMALKLPLTFIGLVVAWLLSNASLSAIMKELTLSSTMNMAAGSSSTGLIDAIIVSTVSLILLYFFFATIISVIEGLYNFVIKFATNDQGSDPFDSEKGGLSWGETKRSFKNMVAINV